jgi:hypothetical protein
LNELSGLGGALPHYDFGDSSDVSTETLTEYAAQSIWKAGGEFTWDSENPAASTYIDAGGTTHLASDIFNSTWVRNDYDGHKFVLTNTQDTTPPVFDWADTGQDVVAPATDTLAGIAKLYQNLDGDNVDGAVSQAAVNRFIDGSTIPLFGMLTTDFELTGSDAFGWALQGSTIGASYPRAIAAIDYDFENGTAATDIIPVQQGSNAPTDTYVINYKTLHGRKIIDAADTDSVDFADSLLDAVGMRPYYIYDAEGQTVKLPVNRRFDRYADDVAELNKIQLDGAPNIKTPDNSGAAVVSQANSGTVNSGPFTLTVTASDASPGGSGHGHGRLQFNASGSSPSYGRNNTTEVRPANVTRFVYYRVGTTLDDPAVVLAQEVVAHVEALQNDKMEKDFSNAPAGVDFIVQSARNLTGTGYTNGWYEIYKSGRIKQGGRTTSNTSGTIVFPLPMPDAKWFACTSFNGFNSQTPVVYVCHLYNRTATGCNFGNTAAWGGGSQYAATAADWKIWT